MNIGFTAIAIGTANVAQPLISTTLSAAFDPHASGEGPSPLTVASSQLFAARDRVIVDSGANTELAIIDSVPSATELEAVPIPSIAPSQPSLQKGHASGAFVALSMRYGALTVFGVGGNTGAIYVYSWGWAYQALASFGRHSLSPSASPNVVGPLIGTIPSGGGQVQVSNVYGANPGVTDELWVIGANAGDKYFVVLAQV